MIPNPRACVHACMHPLPLPLPIIKHIQRGNLLFIIINLSRQIYGYNPEKKNKKQKTKELPAAPPPNPPRREETKSLITHHP